MSRILGVEEVVAIIFKVADKEEVFLELPVQCLT